MLLFHPLDNAFGIDVSDLRLRLIQVKRAGRSLRISSYNELVVPRGYIVEGEIKEFAKVVNLLRTLVREAKGGRITTKYVIASLPERKTFFKVFSVPRLPEQELPGAVRWGIEQNIPVALDTVVYDWQIIRAEDGKPEYQVAVAVISKEIPSSYSLALSSAGLIPIALETESNAIARCLLSDESKQSVMIVDLGASRTSLILIDHGAIHYSSTLDLSGQLMTEHLAQQIHLTTDQAEKAKILCGLDERKGKGVVRKTLTPLFEPLRAKAREIMMFHQNTMQSTTPLTVVLCGGVSQMIGLRQYLQSILGTDVAHGDPFTRFPHPRQRKVLPDARAHSATTALGVALRPFTSSHPLAK